MKTGRTQLGNNLIKACQDGNIEEVKKLIQLGADVNYVNEDGLTALHVAVKTIHYVHLNANANLNYEQLLAMHKACDARRFALIDLLLKHDAEVNFKDRSGNTVLHIAISQSDIDLVNRLIAARADVNALNNANQTPLDYNKQYPGRKVTASLRKANALTGAEVLEFTLYKDREEEIPLLLNKNNKRVPNTGFMRFFKSLEQLKIMPSFCPRENHTSSKEMTSIRPERK